MQTYSGRFSIVAYFSHSSFNIEAPDCQNLLSSIRSDRSLFPLFEKSSRLVERGPDWAVEKSLKGLEAGWKL